MATSGGETVSKWSDSSGKYVYAATGSYQVLFIVSEDEDVSHPDVVRRGPAIELTEEVRGKLENQGISGQHQQDDLSILKARYTLDKTPIAGVERSQDGGPKLTKKAVLARIATLMASCEDSGGSKDWEGTSAKDTLHTSKDQQMGIFAKCFVSVLLLWL